MEAVVIEKAKQVVEEVSEVQERVEIYAHDGELERRVVPIVEEKPLV